MNSANESVTENNCSVNLFLNLIHILVLLTLRTNYPDRLWLDLKGFEGKRGSARETAGTSGGFITLKQGRMHKFHQNKCFCGNCLVCLFHPFVD